MRRFSSRLALVLAFALSLAAQAGATTAVEDTSRTGRTPSAEELSLLRLGGDPTPGTCTQGTAARDLDINNVRARLFNTGSLFFGPTDSAQYIVPVASGKSPIYATGIWIGGFVNGQLRVAGSTYNNFEFWPGPLDGETARPINPLDCNPFDRLFKVGITDIATFQATGVAPPDLRDWPVQWGAEYYLDANGNNRRDLDEPIIARNPGDPGYGASGPALNLAGGERPNLIGDQAIWWVMNDVGNTHRKTLTPPLGVEVQVQAWAFSRSDALGDATFYRYRVINKTGAPIDETFLSIFSDPDLGDYTDDLVGIDTTLSLGFVYNADEVDGGADGYGIPPAAGFDFFQGPVVNGDTLGATRFMYFVNGATAPRLDPANGAEMYEVMRGRWTNGERMFECGNGYQCAGPETVFAFPGDPVTGQFWSEENPGTGSANPGGDRRFVISTGPFSLEPDTPQDIVFGILFGQGSNRLSSVTVLRQASVLAQTAYDADFQLASPPPPPPLCSRDAANPELRPGSGRCAEVVEEDRAVTLVWGYPDAQNILGFRELDQLAAADPNNNPFYEFEGFNIYRYPDARFRQEDAVRVATYDVINGITTFNDFRLDPDTGEIVPFVAARGTDSGIQFTYRVEGLTNYQDVYYGITTYAVNFDSIPKVLESSPTRLTGRPARVDGSGGGSVAQATFGQQIRGTIVSGVSAGNIYVRVVNPQAVRPADYQLEFFNFNTGSEIITTYRIRRDGTIVYDGAQVFAQTDSVFVPGSVVNSPFDNVRGNNVIIDGLEFFTTDLAGIPQTAADAAADPGLAGGGRAVLEVAYPGRAQTCPDPTLPPGATADFGCTNYGNIGNTVAVASSFIASQVNGNVDDSYFVTSTTGALTGTAGLAAYARAAAGHQFEIRFTAQGGLAAQQFGIGAQPTRLIYRVPFEIWNIGQRANDPSDDVRMIPMLNLMPASANDWANLFPRTFTVAGETYPQTAPIFGYMPDRRNPNGPGATGDDFGYRLFEQAALNFGGPGSLYVRANDGDDQIDFSRRTGAACPRQDFFVDFCYRDNLFTDNINIAGAHVISNFTFVDMNRDGQTPPVGTTVRVLTTPRATSAQPGDIFTFSTRGLEFVTGDMETARDALEMIGITPNPYMGQSRYETGDLERIARFTNMPREATIRIYTVSGTLVRTIRKDGPSRSVDWDLTTESGLPVASGMYFIHVDVPGVGERVLKFGVVNRTTQIPIF